MNLFTEQINNWDDWGKVFQSILAFTPLVEHIFQKENLPLAKIENLEPGTNAVFKVGEYVIKIFAPQGMGEDYDTNVDVELFGMRLANAQGVPAPKLIADGFIEDKYRFRYMIMEYIDGKLLNEILPSDPRYTTHIAEMNAIFDSENVDGLLRRDVITKVFSERILNLK